MFVSVFLLTRVVNTRSGRILLRERGVTQVGRVRVTVGKRNRQVRSYTGILAGCRGPFRVD